MTPPASATAARSAQAGRRTLEQRRRLRSWGAPSGPAPAVQPPWWQATLAQLEAREAEAREQLEASREELRGARLENHRLAALVAARDTALADGAEREASLREMLRVRQAEALQARGHLLAAQDSLRADKRAIDALVEERDAALARVAASAAEAEATKAQLRAAYGSLRKRTNRVEEVEAKLAQQADKIEQQAAKIEQQAAKIEYLHKRSKRLTELQESRAYRLMKTIWRVKRFGRR